MTQTPTQTALSDLIARLDRAVEHSDAESVCREIKDALCGALSGSSMFLPEACIQPAEDCYARHLVHKDPAGRYSVVAMVWDSGQCTPLHDHAGSWCVEGVYTGRIEVTSYSLDQEENGLFHFSKVDNLTAKRGECGALIPPFEYHTIANPDSDVAVTVHVYAGELTECHIFQPDENSSAYRRVQRQLCYSS